MNNSDQPATFISDADQFKRVFLGAKSVIKTLQPKIKGKLRVSIINGKPMIVRRRRKGLPWEIYGRTS